MKGLHNRIMQAQRLNSLSQISSLNKMYKPMTPLNIGAFNIFNSNSITRGFATHTGQSANKNVQNPAA